MRAIVQHKLSLVALVVAIVALVTGLVSTTHENHDAPAAESALARVIQSQSIRCSYISRAHHFMIDTATKTKSGIDYEVMEAIGELTKLDIVWTEETGVGTFPELLSSGRVDAHCVTMWTNVARSTRVIATSPVLYTPVYAYVRADDTRFDRSIETLNNEQYVISVADNGTMKAIADASFPLAKQFSITGLATEAELLLNVATYKADATFADVFAVHDYNKNNPSSQLKRVQNVGPLRTYEEAFDVAMGEWELREFLATALNELHNNGTIEAILRRYENYPGQIARVTMPYNFSQFENRDAL